MAEMTCVPVTDELSLKMLEDCQKPGMPTVELLVQPHGVALTQGYQKYKDRLDNFQVRPDDIWLITFPKCGTTWTQELVWLIANDCDFESANKVFQYERFPFLDTSKISVACVCITDTGRFYLNEDSSIHNTDQVYVTLTYISDEGDLEEDTVAFCEDMASPRFIKTHLPVPLLPKQMWTVKPKIIYVTRNPKDAAISYFHHYRLFNGYVGSMEQFLNAFLADRVVFSPYWEHVLAFHALKDSDNILLNSFEDMKRDLEGVVNRTARFLGKPVRKEAMEELLNYLDFKSMKKNPMVNQEEIIREIKPEEGKIDADCAFIRRGQAGTWKKALSPEYAAKFDDWSRRKIGDSGFQYETN